MTKYVGFDAHWDGEGCVDGAFHGATWVDGQAGTNEFVNVRTLEEGVMWIREKNSQGYRNHNQSEFNQLLEHLGYVAW